MGSIRELVEAAALVTGVAESQIASRTNRRDVMRARYGVELVAVDRLGRSHKQVANALCLRDRLSVLRGVRAARQLRLSDARFADLVSRLEARVEYQDTNAAACEADGFITLYPELN